MTNNQSTEAQRKFIAALVTKFDTREAAVTAITPAFKINQNKPWDGFTETITQATRRLTKAAASKAIEDLKTALAN